MYVAAARLWTHLAEEETPVREWVERVLKVDSHGTSAMADWPAWLTAELRFDCSNGIERQTSAGRLSSFVRAAAEDGDPSTFLLPSVMVGPAGLATISAPRVIGVVGSKVYLADFFGTVAQHSARSSDVGLMYYSSDGSGVSWRLRAARDDVISEIKKLDGAVRLAMLLPDAAASADLPKAGVVKAHERHGITRDDLLLYATMENVDAVFAGVDWLDQLTVVSAASRCSGRVSAARLAAAAAAAQGRQRLRRRSARDRTARRRRIRRGRRGIRGSSTQQNTTVHRASGSQDENFAAWDAEAARVNASAAQCLMLPSRANPCVANTLHFPFTRGMACAATRVARATRGRYLMVGLRQNMATHHSNGGAQHSRHPTTTAAVASPCSPQSAASRQAAPHTMPPSAAST